MGYNAVVACNTCIRAPQQRLAAIVRSMAIAEPVPTIATTTQPAPRSTVGVGLLYTPTIEQLAYGGLLLLAFLLRIWQLGERALHHDETLHAFYSWELYSGRGYVHDPLMHGPLLYFANALIYFLFSDSDATARLSTALFGTALVGMPYLLRRELGRGAALLAAAYLACSPAFLYTSRFIRHDTFAIVFELLAFTGAARYAVTRQPRYLYMAVAAYALLVTTMETSYLYAAIFVPLLAALFFWRVWRSGLLLGGTLAVAAVLLVFVLPGQAQKDGENNALRDTAGQMLYTPGPLFGWYPLETDDNGWALRVRNRPDDNLGAYLSDLGPFFAHPAVLTGLVLALATAIGTYFAVWRRRGPDGLSAWQRARGNSIVETFASLGAGGRLWWAAGIFLVIYGLLYTAFLTNMLGLLTGTAGSLLYWLAQHDVKRGGQPWYYYLLLLAIYEPLLLWWGAAGLLIVAGLGLRRLRGHAVPGLGLPLALGWWSLAALALYSWAGEKMPWLLVHVALPLTLLAAWAASRTIATALRPVRGDEQQNSQQIAWRPLSLYLASYGAVAGLGFVLLTVFIGGAAADATTQLGAVVVLVLVLLFATVAIVGALSHGWRWAAGGLALALSIGACCYTLRSSIQLNYRYGDTPRELLIFVQTSPDVARVIGELEAASIRRTGRLDMPVIYDNETVWLWYMRRFAKATSSGAALAGPPPPETMAVLLLSENLTPQNEAALKGFVLQRYPLRWWFPENEGYRLADGWREGDLASTSLLGRALRAPLDDATLKALWNYLLFRQPPGPLGSTDFIVAVRPELAQELGIGTGTR